MTAILLQSYLFLVYKFKGLMVYCFARVTMYRSIGLRETIILLVHRGVLRLGGRPLQADRRHPLR